MSSDSFSMESSSSSEENPNGKESPESPDDLNKAENSLTRVKSKTKSALNVNSLKKKIPLKSWKFTTRQRERIIFLPVMLFLMAAAGMFIALFEVKCAKSIEIAHKIDINHLTFIFMRVCYGGVLLYLFAACCSVLPVKKPSEIWSLNFTFGVVFIWFVSVFIGNHYHSELSRLHDKRFSPLRQESFNRVLKKIYHGDGVFTTIEKRGKNESEIQPTPTKVFFKALNKWLDTLQSSVECCGIEKPEDYNIDLARTFDNTTGITALVPTVNSKGEAISFGLRDKHVLDQLDPDDAEVPDVRESCCKVKTKKCNFNIFETIPANTTNIHTQGCRNMLAEEFKVCHMWFWVIANMPLFIGLPAMFVAYCYVRHAQGLSFKDCKNLRRKRDPELEDENPKPKTKPKDESSSPTPRKSDGRVAPMESNAAVYNVIEHIPPGKPRKSHE